MKSEKLKYQNYQDNMKKLTIAIAFAACFLFAQDVSGQVNTIEEARQRVEQQEKELVILKRIVEARQKQIDAYKAKISELHKQAEKHDAELMILTEHTVQQKKLIKTLIMAGRP
jgi:predicted RNase H-like nuclease (RuvC/YqgF family)